MAVVENAGVDLGINVGSSSASRNLETPDSHGTNENRNQTEKNHHHHHHHFDRNLLSSHDHQMLNMNNIQQFQHQQQQQQQQQQQVSDPVQFSNGNKSEIQNEQGGKNNNGVQNPQVGAISLAGGGKAGFGHQKSNGVDLKRNGEEVSEGFKRDMRDLEELLSKLNPMAEEFVPPSLTNNGSLRAGFYNTNNFTINNNSGNGTANANTARRKKNSFSQGKRRMNSRTSMAQREEIIRRTVYVSDIDHQVTEEQLAALFINCGQVVDCRICGDPNSVLRFAFIEFTDEEGARAALSLAGTMLGYYPVRVLPSKTAIAPVNPTFLPRSEDEREMCARTIYCTNIDKKVSQADVKLFFESICGRVYRLRLLGDYHHSTRIAFVEFEMADSAIAALNCSGVILGSLPIRVSPSKTPVRPRATRAPMH